MDSLSTLFQKGLYEELVRLTEGSHEPEDLYYRASALLALNRARESLEILIKNRDALFAFAPLGTMKGTIGARLYLGEYDKAYADLEDFKNRPYVNQECEEYIRDIPGLITKAIQDDIRNPRAEDASKSLSAASSDIERLRVLSSLQSQGDLKDKAEEVVALCDDDKAAPDVRTYALFLLVAAKYPGIVTFKRGGKIYQVVPKDLKRPYVDDDFLFLTKAFETDAENPDAGRIATSLLATLILVSYPEEAFPPEEVRLIEVAILKLAYESLREEADLKPLYESYDLRPEDVAEKAREITERLNREKGLN